MVTPDMNLIDHAKAYIRDGEEAHTFSYTYEENGSQYYMIYFFDRKKGAYQVTGFLVLDQKGNPVDRAIAEKVNVAFNLYNYVFKRFKHEWGDVVQQDMRKYAGAREHLEQILHYYEQHQTEITEDLFKVIKSFLDTVQHVLTCQDRFLDLDLEVIEIGQQKRENQQINEAIIKRIEKIVRQFEHNVLDQINIQYTSKEVRDRFVQNFDHNKPSKEIKRSVKKGLKMSKRMDKLVTKHHDRLLVRKQDPMNEKHYLQLKESWNAMLRN